MRQFDGEVVDIPSLELVRVVCTPGSHHVEAKQCTRIVANDIVEERILESHTVAVAATVESAYLSRCSATQAIVNQLIEEGRRVEAQTFVEGVLGILVILQYALDAVYIAIQRLHAVFAVDGHTGENQCVVAIVRHTEESEL